MTRHAQHTTLTVLLFSLLIFYLLPWLNTDANALHFGGYDLAEWLSLHPATQPARVPSLLLRGQLVLITWLLALNSPAMRARRSWWLHTLTIALLSVAQLPPLEFLNNLNDTNQQQQAILAAASLLGAFVLGWRVKSWNQQRWLMIGLAGLGIVTSLIALQQGLRYVGDFSPSVHLSSGGLLLSATYGVLGGVLLRRQTGSQHRDPVSALRRGLSQESPM